MIQHEVLVSIKNYCLFELFALIIKEQEKANRYFENYIEIKNKHLQFNAKEKIELIGFIPETIPENFNLIYAKGVFYNQLGDYKRAAITFENLCGRNPAKAEYLFNWAYSLSFLNKLDLAEQLFKQATELNSEYNFTVIFKICLCNYLEIKILFLKFDSREISKNNVSFISDYSLDTSSLDKELEIRNKKNTSSTDSEEDKSKSVSLNQ